MSQNRTPKEKLEMKPHNAIVIDLPMVRNFSTGGGHGPEDTLVEGDEKIVTKKWQGYPPQNLNLVGKPLPPMPEVSIPRFTGKATYATRLNFPNQLWVRLLVSPHPRARIKSLDTSVADKMPGVAHILHYKNVPMGFPINDEVPRQGDVVAMVAADHMRVVWGDSDLAPSAPGWNSGLTTQLQGGALCNAADKMRKDLLNRAAATLKVDAVKLQIREGVISALDDPKKRVTFAELAKEQGRCDQPDRPQHSSGGDWKSDEPRHRRMFP